MPHLFDPWTQRGLTLRNRVVMSPMCMYAVEKKDGVPTDWHMVHLGARAVGGVGLVIAEATAVEPVGRISEQDTGLWNDEQAAAWAPIAAFVKKHGAAFSIQLAHAGRKAWSFTKGNGPEKPVGPSALPWGDGWVTPDELDVTGIERIIRSFKESAVRAVRVGCDTVELHAAHGYLLHEFLSPLSNHRTDEWGGSLANRSRILKRIVAEVRSVIPESMPLWVRISATDWVEGGWGIEESIELSRLMKEWGVDLVDVSTGGNSALQQITNLGPGYQVPFAARIRTEAGMPTGAVGLITDAQQADTIVQTGQADVVLLARELLRNPYWTLEAAHTLGRETKWPVQYERGKFPTRK
ncbi:MAG TPA: NADH:flavin oxidoreductase/NADH oxidase [Symbiobacteriaceae bacterium]|nr:NADH:flavin oxidoreductase/NADH oxidase [Symbiobacteriaceae bacterium]